MNWGVVGAGCFMLLIAGFVGADSISSTIVCDGATWVSSSVLGQGQTYDSNNILFEFTSWNSGLTNNRLKRANPYFWMIKNRNGNDSICQLFLHNNMTPPLMHLKKIMIC